LEDSLQGLRKCEKKLLHLPGSIKDEAGKYDYTLSMGSKETARDKFRVAKVV